MCTRLGGFVCSLALPIGTEEQGGEVTPTWGRRRVTSPPQGPTQLREERSVRPIDACTDERCLDGRGHTYEAGCVLGETPLIEIVGRERVPWWVWLIVGLQTAYVVALIALMLAHHAAIEATRAAG